MSSIPVLAVHGGAGSISGALISSEVESEYRKALGLILEAGYAALLAGARALDAVTLAVSMFEDSPLFNAGRGAVYTSAGTHELDAAVMDGATLAAGAVACVSGVRNPVRAARAVMEHSRHVLMVGARAEDFLREHGLLFEDEEYFHSDLRLRQLCAARRGGAGMLLDHDVSACRSLSPDVPPLDEKNKLGTVGAVALDARGDLAAAASTGGLTNKLPGRVGDTPLIGAGCYADRICAVSCTGTGEHFIRLAVAKDLSARLSYRNIDLEEAGRQVIDNLGSIGGQGGLIAVDRSGFVTLPFNSEGMYRGWVGRDKIRRVAVYGAEAGRPEIYFG
ncbi:MAG: isoaspartyl peptidase/L-asparaginase [Deltaproteobacteria bacterium]|jgi:beta-aspartyl-peptidase (threonine type)|nr:isoaspartyl peptidase/L-asparaginase [Deltaproteobacteria bacterium]